MMSSLVDVAVIGGGPAGLAAAAAAGRLGLAAVLVDAQAAGNVGEEDGRAVALTCASRDRLLSLGLWDAIDGDVWAMAAVRLQSGTAGREHLYRTRDLGRSSLLYGLGYAALRRQLAAAMAGLGTVTHLAGRRLVALEAASGSRRAILDDGTEIQARLIVGADGRRSTVRELAGLSSRATIYPKSALSFFVEGALRETDTALERLTSSGVLSVFPLSRARLSVTWIDTIADGRRRATLAPAPLLAELAAALAMPRATTLELASSVATHPVTLANAERYFAPHLVLVGDAAHGAHPVPAQGVNMTIGDVHELATLWSTNPKACDSPRLLQRFQRNRRLANAARLGVMDLLNRTFPAATAPYALLRRAQRRAAVPLLRTEGQQPGTERRAS